MDIDNNIWILLSIALYLSSLWFFYKNAVRGLFGTMVMIFFVVATILFSLLTGGYVVANWFTGVGFDDSIFYHLTYGLEGAGFKEFYFLFFIFLFIQIFFIVCILLYVKKIISAKKSCILFVPLIQGCILSFSAFFCSPATSNLISFLSNSQSSSDFSDYYTQSFIAETVKRPKNIIYFYLESLEGNYMDETLFPGLLPELHKIKQESVSFTNVGQTIGANWTMAGMVSSQCGLPLLSIFTNDHFSMDKFMPNIICLGDILKSKNYQLEYMGGADRDFAGKNLFYSSHGFSSVKGKNEFLVNANDPKVFNSWGISDDILYEQLLTQVRGLRKLSSPWGVFSINTGTHQPEGFLSNSCGDLKYKNGNDHLLNAVHCTDYLIGKIYESLKNEGVLDDTIVVFSSDHLAPVMVSSHSTLERKTRNNLFMIAGSGIRPGTISRSGTTLDVAPTILNYLNYGSHPIGLGRDLNGQSATLAERFSSQNKINEKLISWRSIIDSEFWEYPKFQGTAVINLPKQQIMIGKHSFKIPVLIRYDSKGIIDDIYYGSDDLISDGDNRYLPAYHLINFVSNTQPFLWVDQCRVLSTIKNEFKNFADDYCFYHGSLSSMYSSGQIIDSEINLNIDKNIGTVFSPDLANQRRKQLAKNNLILWEHTDVYTDNSVNLSPQSVLAVGSDSLVRPSSVLDKKINNEGIYLVSVRYKKNVMMGSTIYVDTILRLPLCDKNSPFSISDVIKEHKYKDQYYPLYYAVVGNVSKRCKKGVINLPSDLSLYFLGRVNTGGAYIAIMDGDLNVIYENGGDADQAIAVNIDFSKH